MVDIISRPSLANVIGVMHNTSAPVHYGRAETYLISVVVAAAVWLHVDYRRLMLQHCWTFDELAGCTGSEKHLAGRNVWPGAARDHRWGIRHWPRLLVAGTGPSARWCPNLSAQWPRRAVQSKRHLWSRVNCSLLRPPEDGTGATGSTKPTPTANPRWVVHWELRAEEREPISKGYRRA